MTKLTIQEIVQAKESVVFLDSSSQAVFDTFDDRDFKQQFYTAIERLKALTEKLYKAEVTVKG